MLGFGNELNSYSHTAVKSMKDSSLPSKTLSYVQYPRDYAECLDTVKVSMNTSNKDVMYGSSQFPNEQWTSTKITGFGNPSFHGNHKNSRSERAIKYVSQAADKYLPANMKQHISKISCAVLPFSKQNNLVTSQKKYTQSISPKCNSKYSPYDINFTLFPSSYQSNPSSYSVITQNTTSNIHNSAVNPSSPDHYLTNLHECKNFTTRNQICYNSPRKVVTHNTCTDVEYESKLVEDIVSPVGAKSTPPASLLNDFVKKCYTLDLKLISVALHNKLISGAKNENCRIIFKGLCVIEALLLNATIVKLGGAQCLKMICLNDLYEIQKNPIYSKKVNAILEILEKICTNNLSRKDSINNKENSESSKSVNGFVCSDDLLDFDERCSTTIKPGKSCDLLDKYDQDDISDTQLDFLIEKEVDLKYSYKCNLDLLTDMLMPFENNSSGVLDSTELLQTASNYGNISEMSLNCGKADSPSLFDSLTIKDKNLNVDTSMNSRKKEDSIDSTCDPRSCMINITDHVKAFTDSHDLLHSVTSSSQTADLNAEGCSYKKGKHVSLDLFFPTSMKNEVHSSITCCHNKMTCPTYNIINLTANSCEDFIDNLSKSLSPQSLSQIKHPNYAFPFIDSEDMKKISQPNNLRSNSILLSKSSTLSKAFPFINMDSK